MTVAKREAVRADNAKIEANVWQKVPGTTSLEIYPVITKPSIISSNCYIFAAPQAILVIDPGASAEQTRHISEIVTRALAVSDRPVLVFLTHCHQDHSQESGNLELPAGAQLALFAHETGVDALRRGDRKATVAYLYPWEPKICCATFHGKLFASSQKSDVAIFNLVRGGRVELHSEPMPMPNGDVLNRQWIPLGEDERLDIYHTPGHTPCSISLRAGSLLILGDLPFTANPGLCGLDGWNYADFVQTLGKVDWLLETTGVTVCCSGHGYLVPADAMRQKLRLMGEEAHNLAHTPLLDEDRIRSLKNYMDELLEEAAALLTTLSGRLYTASFYLSMLEEDTAAEGVLARFNIEKTERILSEFRRFAETFRGSAVPGLTAVLKGVQVAASLQQVLSEESVKQILDISLVGRAQRRLEDCLGVMRGLQFLNAEVPAAVNEVISGILLRAIPDGGPKSLDLMAALDDEQSFLEVLTRRLAARSLLSEIKFDFVPASHECVANVGAERLDDILTNLIEGIAGIGIKQIRVSTEVIKDEVVIRLSSLHPATTAAFGNHRLDLYNRTLGWLGGSLERQQQNDNAGFVIKLPVVASP